MSSLVVHFRKECRDHRGGVLGLGLIMIAAGLVTCLACDVFWIARDLVSKLTIGTMLAATALFAPNLSEQRRGTLRFISRLPSGLHTVFWSKVLFLLVAIAGLTVAAFATSVYLRSMFAPGAGAAFRVGDQFADLASPTLGTAFWLLAASFWLHRSTVCIPAVALLLMAIALPAFMILCEPGAGAAWPNLPMGLLYGLHTAFALAAAWLSFVRGRRAGRGPGSSAWRGLSVAGVGCATLTAIANEAYDDWYWYDTAANRIAIVDATIRPGTRFAYLTVRSSSD